MSREMLLRREANDEGVRCSLSLPAYRDLLCSNTLLGRLGAMARCSSLTAKQSQLAALSRSLFGASAILQARWELASGPHRLRAVTLSPSSLKKQHAKALESSKLRPFVLYTLRHTMVTSLGESGCDVWTLARIAGHSNIRISQRYVHPSAAHIESSVNGLESVGSGDKLVTSGRSPK
jgi:hypothetical protein